VNARDTALQAFIAPLRPFLDQPGVTDLCINRPGEVFVEQHACWHHYAAPELTFTHLQALARTLATYTGQHVDEQHPLLSATLPYRRLAEDVTGDDKAGGERVQVVCPPAVDADTLALCIRKPSRGRTTLQDLAKGSIEAPAASVRLWEASAAADVPAGITTDATAETDAEIAEAPNRHSQDATTPLSGFFSRPLRNPAQLSAVDAEMLSLLHTHQLLPFLQRAVQHRKTIVIAGRTGAGKTTLMRALIEEIPTDERLITIEDAAELFMPRHPNALHLFFSRGDQGAARTTANTLLEACLRLRPDRILLAEMRGDEALSFLRLAASGHPGSLSSVHAGSAEMAFDQIALMARQSPAGKGLTLPELQTLARSVIDIVVHVDVQTGSDGHGLSGHRGRFISDIHFDPHSRLRGKGQLSLEKLAHQHRQVDPLERMA